MDNLDSIRAREQAATLFSDRHDLKVCDEAADKAMQSELVMDMILTGPTLMSVTKNTLRGIIRKQQMKLDRLTAEMDSLKQSKEALENDLIIAKMNLEHMEAERDELKHDNAVKDRTLELIQQNFGGYMGNYDVQYYIERARKELTRDA